MARQSEDDKGDRICVGYSHTFYEANVLDMFEG